MSLHEKILLAPTDGAYMAAALALGRRNMGRTAPNPAVGALVVKDGVIVARGYTAEGGRPHAETIALAAAGAEARGATLYVTLEPCSHHGRTPPCVDAIIAAGIARVVTAIEDPDPRVAGRGHALLREAGIEVVVGPEKAAARCDHLGHILRVTKHRPMVTLKLAQTADGYAAGAAHDPRLHITGPIADAFTHVQRSLHDAIMVGSGTAREDDPLMTVRLPGLDGAKRLRVVLDRRLTLSPRSRLAATARETPVLVIAGEDVSEDAARAFMEATGADVARIPTLDGRLDLLAALRLLADRGITRVFSEGGPLVAESLLSAGFADEVIIHTGFKPLGRPGRPALTPAAGAALESRYRMIESRMLGADQMTRYARMD
ncbi:bifunctional diaminohydroxyphosphoribosylaminopyrimidine deaminase/5-amino-6-(5-phosphoribosylamino)uracil reductase RibD [Methylocystis sp. Sn-Cys]|uniref:bifunctional diaminohydroxyphosphoribosylaminopyrimidine deaminase/5-amino-6-(5-phosphoribosylamino)uracil reductase RibD n=1 Tax=Methylocystis sp. Sn-Cys TaxID=1701263 RepID=UPI0019235A93|nr:bifunctional diaminohydroxyphosphoribosylaminopyrimidine deaminase/5-amino-6-(5-phosphoribosylamino)uracil reductase RibD [Methylocystis sp. Sn-Cys]MBL1258366.1 bifunctional diaminohydroxyphosphoribosylaminopyrimidine deaminase/5-amino-6-(5-phosphoribosylamino)uracil reductase RibD [Methylocystis sp. Sn-Cys]